MRSLLAGLLVLVATAFAVAASVAYVAHQTVLDPAHSGAVLTKAIKQSELRDQMLARTVPGYTSLPAPYRAFVDQAAQSPQVDKVLRRARLDASGRVHLTGARQELARELRANGQPQLAARLASFRGHDTFRLPSAVADQYVAARHRTWWVATRGGAAAAVLYLAALLVARHRRGTLAATGLGLLASVGLTVLAFTRLPAITTAVTHNAWMHAAAVAARTSPSTVVSLLLPVLIGGVVLLLGSLLVPRRR